MKLSIDNYPGSKGGSGITQWIINHIPDCEIFVEGFGGSGKITFELLKNNCTAEHLYLNEIHQPVFEQLKQFEHLNRKLTIKHIDTVEFYIFKLGGGFVHPAIFEGDYNNTVFYFDPQTFFLHGEIVNQRRSKNNYKPLRL